jgi:predicted nucleic acid-binding Zn ribbon protein
MPTYEYKCEAQPEDQEHRYIEVRAITAEEPKELICKVEGCGAKLNKVFFAPPIHFGDGFGGSTFR